MFSSTEPLQQIQQSTINDLSVNISVSLGMVKTRYVETKLCTAQYTHLNKGKQMLKYMSYDYTSKAPLLPLQECVMTVGGGLLTGKLSGVSTSGQDATILRA